MNLGSSVVSSNSSSSVSSDCEEDSSFDVYNLRSESSLFSMLKYDIKGTAGEIQTCRTI